MAQLTVTKSDGTLLFDTSKITYGLVKSGYMVYIQGWTRKQLKSAQLDPNDGSNWTTTTVVADSTDPNTDAIWGFTVYNPISPIVFITGSGTLMGSSVGAGYITFYYACASTSTKFYCFDLMHDTTGSPYLKTYNAAGQITFNSLLPPLNVLSAITAPTPGALDANGHYSTCYVGGANRLRQQRGVGIGAGQIDSYIDISLGAGIEYAAFLPWSRSCGTSEYMSSPFNTILQYSMAEGCYGRTGGITFMFGASAATTQAIPSNVGWSLPCSFFNIPTVYPTALVIATTNYPFPFN